MEVLLSWSGEGARAVAGRLADWLPSLVRGVRTVSAGPEQDGPEARLATVRSVGFAIFVADDDAWAEPWMAFDAGIIAVAGCPALVLLVGGGPRPARGPLAAFGTHVFDETGFRQVVRRLAKLAGQPPDNAEANLQLAWPMIRGRGQAPAASGGGGLEERTIASWRPRDLDAKDPSWPASNPDAARRTWSGEYRGFLPGDDYQLTMRLEVAVVGSKVEGKAAFDGRRSAVLSVHGEHVGYVDNASAGWRQHLRTTQGRTAVGLLYFWDAQESGDRLEVGGIYRCAELDDGSLHGLWYRSGQATPIGEFVLTAAS